MFLLMTIKGIHIIKQFSDSHKMMGKCFPAQVKATLGCTEPMKPLLRPSEMLLSC